MQDSAPIECKRARLALRQGGATEFWLSVPNKIRRRYLGTLEITAVHDTLVPVIGMELEIAVASVVAAESAPGTPLEALKAQAVAARSYMVAATGRHSGFDFCDTTHCQFLRQAPGPESAANRATKATEGLVLAYQGNIIPAMYSASCGGRTRTLQDVGVNSRGYPYFAVECPYCQKHSSQWIHAFDSQQIHLEASHTERERLVLGRKYGWSAVPGNNYQILTRSNQVLIEGRGAGHGIGLCQSGAAAMAASGADFAVILHYYYPNVTLLEARQ
jgi:stage II sporulation protein D